MASISASDPVRSAPRASGCDTSPAYGTSRIAPPRAVRAGHGRVSKVRPTRVRIDAVLRGVSCDAHGSHPPPPRRRACVPR
jgi:hypothetical protein